MAPIGIPKWIFWIAIIEPFEHCTGTDLQIRAPKTAAYYISPIEMGLLWANITYVKSRSKALDFGPQTDMK